MALDCTAEGLAVNSADLSGSLTFKQLLAALVYIQCTANGMDCTPQTLSVASSCLYNCMTEKQLLAALVYVQCVGGSSGGGVSCGAGSPVGVVTPTASCAFYVQTDTVPPYQIWVWANGSWH